MVNYFIYAKDFSGSTEDCEYYHQNGLKTIEQFKNDVELIKQELVEEEPTENKIVYLHWGSKCYEVDEITTVIAYNELKSGNMGTEPETIVRWIKDHFNNNNIRKTNKIKLLYIVTDGLIDSCSVQKCFATNRNMHYETVVFHAFNENLNEIDLSVAASFFKKRCKVYRNNELFDNIDISQAFDYDQINVDNFTAERDNLKSYIKLKFIKTIKHDVQALNEIDKLKKLRDRLFNELSQKSQNGKTNLDTKDKDAFLREFVNTAWYRELTGTGNDMKVDIEKSIATLINYIHNDKKSLSFDALKFETTFNKVIDEEPIVDVNFEAEQEIEFPDIILDDDKGIPVVILTELNLLDKIIFHKINESDEVSPASFSKFKATMECPLFMANDQDISESIGYFYTLNVYKQLLANNTKTEPRTRRAFHGGLVLIDSDQFDKYNDYVLSATYFNFKKINYNVGLFYYVLWKNCENKEWMDKNVVEQFKKYVMRRISQTVCKIGLSSLPLDPPENTSLLTALWYCVELSSCIFKHDPLNFIHERLRMFYGVAHNMIEILEYFNYDLNSETIKKRLDVLRHVMILKKIPRRVDKVYYLLERIFKTEEGFLICEIEKPFNLNKLNYLKLNHKDMLPDDAIEGKVSLNEFVHLINYVGDLNESKAGKGTHTICEKTFRPFFIIDKDKSFYTELLKAAKKVVINDDKDKIEITFESTDSLEFDKILSFYNLFIKCVIDSEKYPSFSEYVEYILKKKRFREDLISIFPPNVYFDAKNVYACYQNIVSKVDINEFIKIAKAYVNRIDRIKAEGVIQFENDEAIKEFITKEELKVNLRKIKV